MIAAAKDREDRTATILTDIEGLERAIEDILGMLDRVAKYVENVIEEEAPPSVALGQFLLNALALAPKVDPADIERDFANHIQDVLVVSYLANTIRTQMDLSNRLATAQLTLGGPEGGTPMPSKEATRCSLRQPLKRFAYARLRPSPPMVRSPRQKSS